MITRLITDETAQRYGRTFGDTTNIGHTMHHLGLGLTVDREELWLDVDTYLHNMQPTPEQREQLRALQQWADFSRSPLLTYQCDGHESLDGAHMGETVYCDGTCWVPRLATTDPTI